MLDECKHIIWDWNGTLLNDTTLCVKVLNSLLTDEQLKPISETIYRDHFNFPVIDFYRWLGFDVDEDRFKQLSHDFISRYEACWLQETELHQDVELVLGKLSEQGICHSALSAAKQEALEYGILHFGIADHFDRLDGADNIFARGKIEHGKAKIKQLPYSPNEIILIGDTVHDFEVAEAMGTQCILLAHGHHSKKRLSATGAPVISNLSQLVA